MASGGGRRRRSGIDVGEWPSAAEGGPHPPAARPGQARDRRAQGPEDQGGAMRGTLAAFQNPEMIAPHFRL